MQLGAVFKVTSPFPL